MILDEIRNLARYLTLLPGLEEALAFLEAPDTLVLPLGRHELPGGAYALVQEYRTAPGTEKAWETHRNFHDLQCLVSGRESIGWSPELFDPGPYAAEKDICFSSKALHPTELLLEAGMFALFFAGEAHRPCVAIDGPHPVRKIIIKLPALPSAKPQP